jgi:hypothetical protein
VATVDCSANLSTTARARIARDASALPLAGGSCAVTWCDERGNWHTAFCEEAESIPAATLATVAVARDGTMISDETTLGEDEAA